MRKAMSVTAFIFCAALSSLALFADDIIDLSADAGLYITNEGHASLNVDKQFLLKDGPRAGKYKNSFAATTGDGENNYMLITLAKAAYIRSFYIENRKEAPERAASLAVWISEDNANWTKAWNADKPELSWSIELEKPIHGRYVKVGLTAKNMLTLNKVRVYGSFGTMTDEVRTGPLTLVYFVGMRDGSKGTDGITFKVEVGEAGKPRTLLAATSHALQEWKYCTADLSAFRGKTVSIRLIADPNSNTARDWGAWGDIAVVEGAIPEEYRNNTKDPRVKTIARLETVNDFSPGLLVKDREIRSPLLEQESGGQFTISPNTAGGVTRRGFYSHPAWKGEHQGAPAFIDFTMDLSGNTKALSVDTDMRSLFEKSAFAATGNYALPPEMAAWDEAVKATQRGAARSFRALFDKAAARGDTRFVIAPGHYRFNGALKTLLVFKAMKNMEIVASGATFWIEDESGGGLFFQDCSNVTIRGLTVDYDPLPFTEGVIVGINIPQNYIILRIIDGFPMLGLSTARFGKNCVLFRQDGTKIHQIWVGAYDITPLEERYVKVDISGRIFVEPYRSLEKGSAGLGDVFVIPPRMINQHTFLLSGCARMSFENVAVFASSMFGFYEGAGGGANRYSGCRIVRRPDTKRFISGNADGIHSCLMDKGPTIENCEIAYNCDDANNIRGNFAMVAQAEDDTHVQLLTPFGKNIAVGSQLSFYDYLSMKNTGTVRISALEAVTDAAVIDGAMKMETEKALRSFPVRMLWRATLDAPVTTERYAMVASDMANGDGFIVRSNYFHDNNGRGTAIKAAHGLIEGNRYERTAHAGIHLSSELYWLEGPIPHDVTIRNNTLTECVWNFDIRMASSSQPGTICASIMTHGGELSPVRLMYNIAVENNSIVNSGSAGMVLVNMFNSVVRGNNIVNEKAAGSLGNGKGFFGEEMNHGICIISASNITISENTVTTANEGIKNIRIGKYADAATISVK
ncbi:MAG: right-handed parallel beta-helix repeat-containing protein [Spirochaetota bacterium]